MRVLRRCPGRGLIGLCATLWLACAEAPPQLPAAAGPGGQDDVARKRTSTIVPAQPLSDRVVKKGRSYRAPMEGAQRVRPKDHVDVLVTVQDPQKKERVAVTIMQNLIVLDNLPVGQLAVLVLPEEAELLALGARIGKLHVTRRHPKDVGIHEDRWLVNAGKLWEGQLLRAQHKERFDRFQRILEKVALRGTATGLVQGARELCLPLRGGGGLLAGDHLDLLATVRLSPGGTGSPSPWPRTSWRPTLLAEAAACPCS